MTYFIKSWDKLYPYLVITLCSVIPFWKTGLRGLMERTDADFPLRPITNFYSQTFVWYDKVTMGYDISSASLSQLPFYSIIALLEKIGLSLPLIERFWFISGIAIAGYSFFCFSHYVSGNKIGSVLAALFYMFNPFVLFQLSQGGHIAIFSYGFIPLTLLFAHQGIKKKKHVYSFYIGLISIPMAVTNVPNLAVALLPLVIFLIFSWLGNKGQRKFTLYFSIFSVLSTLLLNLWWLIPGLSSLNGGSQSADLTRMWLLTWQLISLASNYFSVLTITGVPGYVAGSIIALTLIVVPVIVLAIFILFDKKFKNGEMLRFGLLLLGFSLIFAVGNQGAWGNVQQLIMSKVSILQMFRNPYRFAVITILSYCILIPLVLNWVSENNKKWVRNFSFIALFILILLSTSPILTGNLNSYLKPIDIPNEYLKLANDLNSQHNEGNILIMPQEEWLTKFKWTDYDMPDFSRYLFNNPILRFYPENRMASQDATNLLFSIYDYLEDEHGSNVSELTKMMGVRYILLRKDIDSVNSLEANIVKDPTTLSRILESQKNMKLIKSNEYFNLYELSNYRNQIFASNNIKTIPYKYSNDINPISKRMMCVKSYNDFYNLINNLSNQLNQDQVYFFNPQKSVPEFINNLKNSDQLPRITYDKISPVEYEVTIENASSPFVLILNQSFNKNWQLIQKGEDVSEDRHFILNNYANSWFIDQQGSYKLKLFYRPQKIVNVLLVLESLAILGGTLAIILLTRKNAKKTKFQN